MSSERGERQAIQHALGRYPSLACYFDAPVREIYFVRRVRIRIDAQHAAQFKRPSVPAPIEIKPPRIGIDFDSDAVPGASLEDCFDIELIAWPA